MQRALPQDCTAGFADGRRDGIWWQQREQGAGRQLAGGENGMTARQTGEKCGELKRFKDLQRFVGGVALQTADAVRGIADGDAFVAEEIADGCFAEAFAVGADEMFVVVEENEAEDAPHVVLDVRVVKIHFPALARRREAAKHEQACVLRGEGQ